MSNKTIGINSSSGEVDLAKFLQILWLSRVKIFLCVSFFTIISIIYAVSAQQWWTSKSLIMKPGYQNTLSIREQLTGFISFFDKDKSEINDIFDSNKLLNNYIVEFNSYDNKKAFIEKNSLFEKMNEKNKLDNNSIAFYDFWAEKVTAEKVKKGNGSGVYELKFRAESPKYSYELLSEYSKFTEKKVQSDLVEKINAIVQYNLKLLKSEYSTLKFIAKDKLAIELAKTDLSIAIASAADVKKPIANMSNDTLFPIDLGLDALKEKKLILTKNIDLSIFEPKIKIIQNKIDLLSKVTIKNIDSFQSVRYLKKPNYPTFRDKPNRVLIVFVGFVFGWMIAIAAILFKLAIIENKNNIA
ncbi:Wzz/FepE/Etk N-terminal domain-containing protein [Photobacterium leiognathi]|uniref:Wzz/FepE/Etk N-terminal domain-containing protein n=1 Tax=Photobacterium leiognathi TaxID=553611 RepID=UPI0029812051|nr:Wzz/FepE/Etk N-terminal domain-containing protein [Photobacterium leiognathi]